MISHPRACVSLLFCLRPSFGPMETCSADHRHDSVLWSRSNLAGNLPLSPVLQRDNAETISLGFLEDSSGHEPQVPKEIMYSLTYTLAAFLYSTYYSLYHLIYDSWNQRSPSHWVYYWRNLAKTPWLAASQNSAGDSLATNSSAIAVPIPDPTWLNARIPAKDQLEMGAKKFANGYKCLVIRGSI